ncbi:MAG: toprim domain-containing protein, partial [Nitrobacter sp.]
PKYLNSPETPIFHKGSIVFNFHRARQPAHEANSVVAVEGYMDAIAVYQAGIKAVVATMGTAFTEEQIATLWRLSPEPVVCFDSDRAGIAAAYRSVDRILPLLRVGKTFRFVFMDDQKDPDDLIREKGVEAFRNVLSGSLPLWDVLWQRETDGHDVRTPDSQAALEQKLYALVRTIQDPAINTAFYRTSRMQLANLFWQVNRGPARNNKKASSKSVQDDLKFRGEGQRSGLQKVVLGMLVEYPELLEDKQDSVERLHFPEDFDRFLTHLFQLLLTEPKLSVSKIWEEIDPEFYKTLQTVHGEAGEGKRRGHRLFESFAILGRDPPLDFVSGCTDHFMKVLHLHEIEDDIQRAKLEAGQGEESAVARLLSLVRESHAEQENISTEGVALSEWAEDITRVWAPQRGTMHLAA